MIGRPGALRAVCTAAALLLVAAQTAQSQPDSVRRVSLAPGVEHVRIVRAAGPWIINVVTADMTRAELQLQHVRAADSLRARETLSSALARHAAGGQVLAAVNGDFFDVQSGESENNVIVAGEWWKGIRVTDSPFDTFDNVHSQFAVASDGTMRVGRYAFGGFALFGRSALPVLSLNADRFQGSEGSALYTRRFGGHTPADSSRAAREAVLDSLGRRGDTLVFRVRSVAATQGSEIRAGGAVLAAYGARASALAALTAGDTVRIVLTMTDLASPSAQTTLSESATPELLIGGWPAILRNGADITSLAPLEEGTISRNAEARHPRTAVAISANRRDLLFVTVDGRSDASVGMTLHELATLLLELGATDALNLDGGGSTTMIVSGVVANSPSDPAGERPVGSMLLLISRSGF